MKMPIMLVIGLSMISGCVIPPGRVAVEVSVCGNKPDAERYTVVRGGRVWAGPCTEIYYLPTREQRAVWTESADEGSPTDESITFAGVDGQGVNVDIGISYSIATDDESVTNMIRIYGPDLESTLDSKVRDYVRDSLNACASDNGMTVQDLYGAGKTKVMSCAENRVQEEFGPNGLVINRLTLNSKVRLPSKIQEAMEKAQAATQEADRTQREVEIAKADAEKRVIAAQAEADANMIRAKGEAEANKLLTESLTSQVLDLRRMEVEEARIAKWNGSVPTTVLGQGGGVFYTIDESSDK